MYEIARHFTEKARRTAAGLTYLEGTGLRTARRARYRGRTCCPLGVMLRVEGKETLTHLGAPTPYDVARALLDPFSSDWTQRYGEAQRFIGDWDDGNITELAGALGVTQSNSHNDA